MSFDSNKRVDVERGIIKTYWRGDAGFGWAECIKRVGGTSYKMKNEVASWGDLLIKKMS